MQSRVNLIKFGKALIFWEQLQAKRACAFCRKNALNDCGYVLE